MDIGKHFDKKAVTAMSDAEFIAQYKGKLSIPLEEVWLYCTNKKLKRNGRNHKKGKKGSEAGHSGADSSSSEETKD